MTSPQSAPVLSTERLDLWQPQAGDLQALVDLLAPDAVRQFLGGRPTGVVEEFGRLCRNAGSWALYGYGTFVCRAKGMPDVLGICGVFHSWRGFGKGLDDVPEIGWIFGESTWGKGFAGEAARGSLDWFDQAHGQIHSHRRVACMIEEGHDASLAIAQRLGFVRYGQHDEGAERPLILLERL